MKYRDDFIKERPNEIYGLHNYIKFLEDKLEERGNKPAEQAVGTVLVADHAYTAGKFHVVLNENSDELKVIVNTSRDRLILYPSSSNCCTLAAWRS